MAFLQVSYHSDVLGKATAMNVILPENRCTAIGMRGGGAARMKTLYLLHGLSDDHTIWMRRTSIERYASDYGIAVIMPDGGRGFYTDALYGERRWTAIAEELPRVCREFFRLSDAREDNAVAGLSMGGYGALKLALRCPARFFGAAALSPVTEPELWMDDERGMADEARRIFGDKKRMVCRGDDLTALAKELLADGTRPKPVLFHAEGDSDFMLAENRRFAAAMRGLNYPCYRYIESSGSHDWKFWDRAVQDALKFLFGDGAK